MYAIAQSPAKRIVLAALVAAGAFALVLVAVAKTRPAAPSREGDSSIRPLRINVPKEALVDLHRRIAATKWPEQERVTDATQGIQLDTIQKLAHYWATDYDRREVEARLNALPQFVTMIDALDIHFIHVRSKHANALPVMVTHGWLGSIIEQLKIVGPITDPIAYGGKAEDAFDVVIPSLPRYGFSGPLTMGCGPTHRLNKGATNET